MPIVIGGQNYYRTSEACKMAGVSRATFIRWLKEGILRDASHTDRRGWRLFTEDDITRIRAEANKVKASDQC